MSSNLPPGVSEGSIPGNRPEDGIFDQWLEGTIGDLLFQLAGMAANEPPYDIGSELERVLEQAIRDVKWYAGRES